MEYYKLCSRTALNSCRVHIEIPSWLNFGLITYRNAALLNMAAAFQISLMLLMLQALKVKYAKLFAAKSTIYATCKCKQLLY